jgi:hypothetical protein
MAPEQWQGHAAESATDQFGWSVMAWELLYGERPFAGDTLLALGEAVVTGQRRPAGRGVPGWLRRVLERGLATAPAQRWPTMTAMLAALERGRTRTRMRTAAAALAGVVLLGAGVEGARRRDIAARVAICEAAGAEIDAAWNDERRQRLREALVGDGCQLRRDDRRAGHAVARRAGRGVAAGADRRVPEQQRPRPVERRPPGPRAMVPRGSADGARIAGHRARPRQRDGGAEGRVGRGAAEAGGYLHG